ncbi:MAG: 50S ribosomal protein L13 [Candidatus Saliniplasma sp.]
MKVYDGEDKILGRLATQVAEDLLSDEDVRVVNAEKVFITGDKTKILEDYKEKRERGKVRKGPYYPRRPERIFKRTVRGMLPYQQPRGRKAFKRLRAYIGVPSEFEGKEFLGDEVKTTETSRGLPLEEISKHLGAKF